jgi:hypothetical protein
MKNTGLPGTISKWNIPEILGVTESITHGIVHPDDVADLIVYSEAVLDG